MSGPSCARCAGASESLGVEESVDLRMGTFSKSFASCGGFIAGPAEVIDYLRIAAASFLFRRCRGPGSGRRRPRRPADHPRRGPGADGELLDNAAYLHGGLTGLGLRVVAPTTLPDGSEALTPIVPVIVGEDAPGGDALEGALRGGLYTNVALHPAVRGRSAASHEPDGDRRDRALDRALGRLRARHRALAPAPAAAQRTTRHRRSVSYP